MRRRISVKAQKPPTKTTTQPTILLQNFVSRGIIWNCSDSVVFFTFLRWSCILSNIQMMVRPLSLFHRTNILFAWQPLWHACTMFKNITFFIRTLFAWLYVRVDIWPKWGKHLYYCIISLQEVAWVNKTSSSPPPFVEVLVTCQESEWSCICVLGVSILHLSTIFLFSILLILSLKV